MSRVANIDVHELHGGKITDARIEAVMQCLIAEQWEEPHLAELFNEICQEFMDPNFPEIHVPLFDPSAGNSTYGVMLLVVNRWDFTVATPYGNNWPIGGFDYMLDATVGVTIQPTNSESTLMVPGRSLNQAVLLAIMQLARERADMENNQGTLALN